MDALCQSVECCHRVFPLDNEIGTCFYQLLVPEGKLIGVCLVFSDHAQKLVALPEDAVISLQVAQILVVNLGVGDVEVAAAQGRLTSDQVYVIDAECYHVELSDEVSSVADDAVYPNAFLDRSALGRRLPL